MSEIAREVTVSTNRQVGLPSDFARRLAAKPGTKLLEVLVRLPDGDSAVLLMRRPKRYARALAATLRGEGSASAFVAALRREWPE